MAEKKKEDSKGYQKGDALKGTVPDLNDVNFRNKDVMKWQEISGRTGRQTPVQVQGLATLSNKTKLPRYSKK
jgi:hypothetical protein